MKRWIVPSLIVVASLLVIPAAAQEQPPEQTPAAAPAQEQDMDGNVQFLIGQRYLGDIWEPIDEPMMFGMNIDFAPASSPVHVALGFSIAWDQQDVATPVFGETGDVQSGFFEFSAGFVWLPVKKAFVRPYLGAGVVILGAGVGSNFDFWDAGDGDHSFGFYANGGLFFKVGESFNIGFDGRIVRGTEVTLSGQEGDADYEQVSMLIGFSF
jgi:hypothetical protein